MDKESMKEWSTISLRLALGIVFIMHGSQKLFGAFGGPGISGFAGYLGNLSIPASGMLSIIVAIVEFFGGLFVLLGLFTRYASLLIAIDMLVAFLAVHMKNGFFVGKGGFEVVMILFFISMALAMSGSGKLSLEKILFKKGH